MDMQTSQSASTLPESALVSFFQDKARDITILAGKALSFADRPTAIHMLAEGWLMRSHLFESGKQSANAIYLPGDFLDMHNLVSPGRDDAITALTDATLLCVNASVLASALTRQDDLLSSTLRYLVADARYLREAIGAIGQLNTDERLSVFVAQTRRRLIAARRLSPSEQGFTLPLTQQQLGMVIGATIIHTNRVIRRLREANILSIRDRWVEIHDLNWFDSYTNALLN